MSDWPITVSVYRETINSLSRSIELSGTVLDIGGGPQASYWKCFKTKKNTKVISFNLNPREKPTKLVNLEKGIPFPTKSADTIIAYNILEHVFNFQMLVKDAARVLKRGGIFYAATPFIKEIHENPQDYFRLSPAAWDKILEDSGFSSWETLPIACGPLIATYSLIQTTLPHGVLTVIFPLCQLIDSIILKIRPYWKKVYVLGVFVKATR